MGLRCIRAYLSRPKKRIERIPPDRKMYGRLTFLRRAKKAAPARITFGMSTRKKIRWTLVQREMIVTPPCISTFASPPHLT
jgi:hypothetical protein